MEFYDYGEVSTWIFDDGPDRFAIERIDSNYSESLQLLCDNGSKPGVGPASVDVDLDDLVRCLVGLTAIMSLSETSGKLQIALETLRKERPS